MMMQDDTTRNLCVVPTDRQYLSDCCLIVSQVTQKASQEVPQCTCVTMHMICQAHKKEEQPRSTGQE